MKVFSATKFNDRQALGEKVTAWLEANPQVRIIEKQVLQSSDSEFHCLTIVLFFDE